MISFSPLMRLKDFSFGRMRLTLSGGAYLGVKAGSTYRLVTENYLDYKMMTVSGGEYFLKSQGGPRAFPVVIPIGKLIGGTYVPSIAPNDEFPVDPDAWKASFEPIDAVPDQYIQCDNLTWPLEKVHFVSYLYASKLHDVFEGFTSEMYAFTDGSVVTISISTEHGWQEIWRSKPGVNLSSKYEVGRLLVLESKRMKLTYDPLPDVLPRMNELGQRLQVWMETDLSGGGKERRRLFTSQPAAQISIDPLVAAGLVDEDGYILSFNDQGDLPVFGRNAMGPFAQIDTYTPAK